MDVSKPAVAEHAYHVAAVDALSDVLDDGLDIGQIGGGLAGGLQVLHQAARVEPLAGRDLLQAGDFGNDYRIRVGEGRGQFGLEDVSARGVGARLEDGP